MEPIINFFAAGGTAATLVAIALAVALGLALGRVKIKSFSLGVTNVLFVGIALSAMGLAVDHRLVFLMRDLGLVLFIFAIGLQTGPSFFAGFRRGGLRLNLLAVAIVVLGAVTALLLAVVGGESFDVMAGVYSGAITSTPGMSAAQQAASGAGMASADIIANGYAVSYPIGVVGPIVYCILIRNICHVRLDNEPVASAAAEKGGATTDASAVGNSVAVLFVGLLLGVALGSIELPVGMKVPMKLGLAGGPLVVAILMGHFGTRVGWIDNSVTSGVAMQMVREMGIALFLASVGLSAGGSFVQTISGGGYVWVVYAVVIALLPLLVVGLFARRRLNLDFYSLMGLAGGATTDTPALAYANSVANNPSNCLPSASYAAVYPLTVFMRIFTAQVMVMMAV